MEKKTLRIRRSLLTRSKIYKNNKIRLVVHRTSKNIYAQIISKCQSKVLVSASTLEKNIANKLNYTGNKIAAKTIGKKIAQRAIQKNIKYVAFDRSGFKYHGRIKSLALAARKYGLCF